MKRKKDDLKVKIKRSIDDDVYEDNVVKINKEENGYFFEIGKELTADVAEAVSILMRKVEWDNPIWEIELKDITFDQITPERSLFWLSGGYSEWRTLDHYNKPWCDCYLEFQEEFGFLILNIVNRSKKLKDIRDNFAKHLNLPVLYDFAISRNMTKLK
jgi:hypothetical protein